MGIDERVKGFLESWLIIREQLDKILEEDRKNDAKVKRP